MIVRQTMMSSIFGFLALILPLTIAAFTLFMSIFSSRHLSGLRYYEIVALRVLCLLSIVVYSDGLINARFDDNSLIISILLCIYRIGLMSFLFYYTRKVLRSAMRADTAKRKGVKLTGFSEISKLHEKD